ncbi:hypothetical protein K523DRAFT_372556 [Schizophyllum commune Tattone D]|nr:hypothetical protein K523DRAFT_372556 [Schizophyllum commune Tattone D]
MQPSVLALLLALALSPFLASSAFAQQKTLPYNFTLAALNTTLPNANDTGAPLVLGYEAYIIGGVIYFETTYASSPDGADVPLGLVNGALRAYGRDGSWHTNASVITSGNAMGWFSSTWRGSPETDQFTALHTPSRHHKYATLAAHGQESLWSLCPTGNNGGKNEVFYNISTTAAPGSQIVVPEDCYKVILQIVPLQ